MPPAPETVSKVCSRNILQVSKKVFDAAVFQKASGHAVLLEKERTRKLSLLFIDGLF
ncbi:hypothetical protein [Komagataeibacter europaeus]|uniref:hypothetical protein n=1 Tax=Komagataeibacter europaeus TaxID=33995 RepID=UPI0012F73FB4|nr:hypothetical protein [Komagataeibacter europaeus]